MAYYYTDNATEILLNISNSNFYALLKYTKFLWTDIHRNDLLLYLFKTAPLELSKYVIENCVDLNQLYDRTPLVDLLRFNDINNDIIKFIKLHTHI